jgi:hypothetical protein
MRLEEKKPKEKKPKEKIRVNPPNDKIKKKIN